MKKNKQLLCLIDKRFNIFIIIIVLVTLIFFFRLFNIQIKNNVIYEEQVKASALSEISSNSTPRGRIYDRNGKLLVDNKPIKTIFYKKCGLNELEEVQLAYKISNIIDINYDRLTEYNLKTFYKINNQNIIQNKITKEEYQQLEERKLNSADIEKLIYERITTEELKTLNDLDKKAAYIYFLMNKGYSFSEKIIKNKNVTDYEYAYITENQEELSGFNTKLEWERIYLYDNTLKSVLGKVSTNQTGIPKELKNYYLALGYKLNDRVGISGIEYQYESYLKGHKAKYRVKSGNVYELIEKGTRGNDIHLTIDIDLQLQVDEIIEEEIRIAKESEFSKYYNHSFVIVGKPNTGEILAISGKQLLKQDEELVLYDYTSATITSPVTVGSVIKGASHAVGYKYGAIDIGTKLLDQCIKLLNTPIKCSYRSGLGVLDDVQALKWSSNSYQFQTAMKVGGGKYGYNKPLKIDTKAFEKYRMMYNSYGLGVLTGIDLPNESNGYKGNSLLPGLLLDFSIGQYDTYTPIQLFQYINTVATKGYRITPHLLKNITNNDDDVIYTYKTNIINKVDLETKYLNRIIEGFKEVMNGPLGIGYLGAIPNAAGKTGTSQSFLDTTSDGQIDTATLTNTFAGFYPYDDPQLSFVIVSPNVLPANSNRSSRTNRRIATKVGNATYNIYKY